MDPSCPLRPTLFMPKAYTTYTGPEALLRSFCAIVRTLRVGFSQLSPTGVQGGVSNQSDPTPVDARRQRIVKEVRAFTVRPAWVTLAVTVYRPFFMPREAPRLRPTSLPGRAAIALAVPLRPDGPEIE